MQNSEDGRNVILLLNFNLPSEIVEDRQTELPHRLREIANFLDQNFGPADIYYQLSASYWLQHRVSQNRRRWVGSFFARDTSAASITGAIFLHFNKNTFVPQGLHSLALPNIVSSLTVNFADSAWHFAELIAVIVNCQLVVPVTHPFVVHHGLMSVQRRQRRARRHVTLFPFGPAGDGGLPPAQEN